MKRLIVTVVLAVASATCRSTPVARPRSPHYVVSADPISVRSGPGGLCVAIDPADPNGVWWWGPGRSGCSTRNTIPGPHQENAKGLTALFQVTDAVVSRDKAGATEARFRLPMHGPPDFVDVDLIIHNGHMLCVATGAQVRARQMSHLDIPLLAPY